VIEEKKKTEMKEQDPAEIAMKEKVDTKDKVA